MSSKNPQSETPNKNPRCKQRGIKGKARNRCKRRGIKPKLRNKTKILVVEDEIIVADDIRESLEEQGYAVSGIAATAEEAITKAEEENPDLVLMDIMLRGEMDGIETAQEIRSRFDIPVIFLTAFADEEKLDRAKVSEPFGFIIKPFEDRELHISIQMALYKHEAEKELRRAKEEAETATELKDKFVSLVAHDLRGPLATFLAFLKLIKDDTYDPEEKKMMLERAENTGKGMLRLIDDLLNISRLKTGKIQLKLRFFNTRSMALRTVYDFKPLAEKKNVRFINRVEGKERLYADECLFYEVIRNLVSNAIKFCKEGDVITLFIPEGYPSTLAVSDTGTGIKPESLGDIFKYDEKTSCIGTDGERGTGLGLPLSQDIMAAHGGDLTIESTPGKGSVFYARLPHVTPRILVVDDDQITRELIKSHLGTLHVDIIEAEDGEKAIEAMKKSIPHMIITNLIMPEMGGFKFMECVKKDPKTMGVPLIVVTADRDMKTRDKTFSMGAQDFVTKPLSAEDLVPRVRRFLE